MRVRLIVLGLILAIGGVICVDRMELRIDRSQQEIEEFYAEHGTAVDLYTETFNDWSQLSLQDKLDSHVAKRRRGYYFRTAAQIGQAVGIIVLCASAFGAFTRYWSKRCRKLSRKRNKPTASNDNHLTTGGQHETPMSPAQAALSPNEPAEILAHWWAPSDNSKPATRNVSQIAAHQSNAPSAMRKNITSNQGNAPLETAADKTLIKLTAEVAGLRKFAATQQDQVRKLQDGYDWTILKNFCLRTIRCVDNLDERISRLSNCSQDTRHLEEVRDDLVFALESSRLEKFQPELGSDTRGRERDIEVAKERCVCDDNEQIGKIAEVVRCGYQYVISDENVKIIRTAQVRLFALRTPGEPALQIS